MWSRVVGLETSGYYRGWEEKVMDRKPSRKRVYMPPRYVQWRGVVTARTGVNVYPSSVTLLNWTLRGCCIVYVPVLALVTEPNKSLPQ